MRSMFKLNLLVLAFLLLFAMQVMASDDAEVKETDVPKAVLNVFKTAHPQTEIAGFDKEVVYGKTLYEVETVQGKVEKDFIYSEDGTLVKTDEEISVEALPESVIRTVKSTYPDCEFDEAEKITRGSTIEYEIVIEVGEDNEFELLVSSDGQILSSDQMDEDEDDGEDDDDDDDDDD